MLACIIGLPLFIGILYSIFSNSTGINQASVLEYYDDRTLKSNYSENPDGEEWSLFYHDKYNLGKESIYEEIENIKLNLNRKGRIILYYENGNKKAEERGTFKREKEQLEGTLAYAYGGYLEGIVLHGEGRRIFYYPNGNKSQEQIGIFNYGSLKGGEENNYYENGSIIKEEPIS